MDFACGKWRKLVLFEFVADAAMSKYNWIELLLSTVDL